MDVPEAFLTSLRDADKLEAIIPCVGFDDLLDHTLGYNTPHLDHILIVTTPEDSRTILVAQKYGASVVVTDLFKHQGKSFTKGAALNMGLARAQFSGWRLMLDADIVLPDNFRRVLMNHTHLDPQCLYGADRVDVIGEAGLYATTISPQWGLREEVRPIGAIRSRVVTKLSGYLPLGYFQLWNSRMSLEYPSSAGGAGLDDVLFAQQWPVSHRRLLPSVIVYHLCYRPPVLGENWDGVRRHPRMENTDAAIP